MNKSFPKIMIIVVLVVLIFIYINSDYGIINKKKLNESLNDYYEDLGNPEKKEMALNGFIKNEEQSCIFLTNKMQSENDDLRLEDIIILLGYMNCVSSKHVLIKYINHNNWRIRFFTIQSLEKIDKETLLDHLHDIIGNDNNDKVRIEAVSILGKYGKKDDVFFLKKMMSTLDVNTKLKKSIDQAITKIYERGNEKGVRRVSPP